ncbi:uncharacterized protein M421DRAFT_88837 [Didymella exigua CBS 183.55]|uniref:Apple domain-containing protein n=1 Tax=Didymella exigua CBS 183.55 TaxID=1150837 RepID=A0A6A5S1L9_9PLEO|nr:uncharacterized protein M421DRAFT_88837 [Didymella exigua CBS 183.55]KAF1933679.1 hypothetical protein M421DRAFT_88837 [Didymella exigua CBS 183.55]
MGICKSIFIAVALLAVTLQPILAMPQPTAAPELVTLNKRACSADNCLRAVRNNVNSAIPFCSTYTTAATATIPTWAANCQDNPTRVTSACNCLATAPLTKVYGPTDGTNYTIFSQAQNIRSRPETWEESLTQCIGMCQASGSNCQTFSLAVMPRDFNGEPGGLTLCYL